MDERQTNSSGENSEKISEWTKSFIDELKVKTDEQQANTAEAKTINEQYHIHRMNSAMIKQNHEKWRESKECLFIYFWLAVLVY